MSTTKPICSIDSVRPPAPPPVVEVTLKMPLESAQALGTLLELIEGDSKHTRLLGDLRMALRANRRSLLKLTGERLNVQLNTGSAVLVPQHFPSQAAIARFNEPIGRFNLGH